MIHEEIDLIRIGPMLRFTGFMYSSFGLSATLWCMIASYRVAYHWINQCILTGKF